MRLAALIAATAVALALNACSKTEEAAPDVAATEAAEASGVATLTAEEAAAAAAEAANAPYSAAAGEAPEPTPTPEPAPAAGEPLSPDTPVDNSAATPAP